MKFYSYLLIVLLLASNATAECRNIECMPNQYTAEWVNSTDWTFYYDSVFTIGDTWFLIFLRGETEGSGNPETIRFEFENGPAKVITDFDEYVDKNGAADNGSISFPGTTFTEESFHNVFYINFTRTNEENGQTFEVAKSFELEIQINENPSPANDLVYLWGGMTVFWLSIGLYIIYISNKLRELSDKIGAENNGVREKD
jgi:hypothetical protein